MKVMKFGGTSVGSPERMKGVASLVTESGEPTFIVLSAMSGTTNSLVEISDYLYKKNPEGANEVINNLEKKYMQHVEELYSTEEMKKTTSEFLHSEFDYLRSFTKDLFTSFEEKSIVAQGEIMSTNMVVNYLKEQGIKAVLLNALDFMRTDNSTSRKSLPTSWRRTRVSRSTSHRVSSAAMLMARLTTCSEAAATIQHRSSVQPFLPTRSRYGPTSMACTTTTHEW